MPDDNDYDPVQGGVGLKVGVQSREGIRVVGPWLIVEECNQQEYCEIH